MEYIQFSQEKGDSMFKTKDDVLTAIKNLDKGKVYESNSFHFTPPKNKLPIKYYKTLGVFKSSNVQFDPIEVFATSYSWWIMVKRINGKTVFNDYSYSVSTRKHQNKVRRTMSLLGLKIDLFIEAPQGLQSLDSALHYYESRIETLTDAINKPRTRKSTNEARQKLINHYKIEIEKVKGLINA